MSVTYYTREELLNAQSKGFRLGQEDESQRIIKLLEAEYEQGSYEMGIVPHLIALIKGGNSAETKNT